MSEVQPLATGLVVFDLDGTLLRGHTVCELLAHRLGVLPRMQEIERLRQRELIHRARYEMAAWYRDLPESTLHAALDDAQFAPGLELAIRSLRDHGVVVGIASITWRFAVERYATRWQIDHVLATGLEGVDRIDHVWPEHKGPWLNALAAKYEVPRERTAAIGDSSNDLGMLAAAGLGYFVGSDLPGEARAEVLHRPAADLAEIAADLLARWGLRSPAFPP
jgi:phosphoserine phosphatase